MHNEAAVTRAGKIFAIKIRGSILIFSTESGFYVCFVSTKSYEKVVEFLSI